MKNHMFSVRATSFLLLIMLLCGVWVGCTSPGASDITTSDETQQVAPSSEPVELNISQFSVVLANNCDSELTDRITVIAKELKAAGFDIRYKSDYVYPGEDIVAGEYELLIGLTNRPESAKYLSGLREKDNIIAYENDRVIIGGGSTEATIAAVERFVDQYLDLSDGSFAMYPSKSDLVKADYAVGYVELNGAWLSEYSIVYDDDSVLAQYAAENLCDLLYDLSGVELKVVSDAATAETDHEILIGLTDRAASITYSDVNCGDGEYLLAADNGKIVMLGDGYMVGGGASALVWDYIACGERGADVSVTVDSKATVSTVEFTEPTSAILMIGDGMGPNHIEAARSEGMEIFFAETLPNVGTCRTYSYSVTPLKQATYTDSAAAATALATGYKTINGYVGLDQMRKSRKNVRELAQSTGAKTAIITTDVITGATPAGFLAHCLSRKSTAEIQSQIDALIADGSVDWCAGSVDNELRQNARDALKLISADGSNFFMMLEEAYIDKNSHNNVYDGMVDAVKRFNDTIAYVIEFVVMHPNTALIVTADHETGGVKTSDSGSFAFTKTTHTNTDVPLFTIGYGTETLTVDVCNNVNIAKFIATIFGNDDFGSHNVK